VRRRGVNGEADHSVARQLFCSAEGLNPARNGPATTSATSPLFGGETVVTRTSDFVGFLETSAFRVTARWEDEGYWTQVQDSSWQDLSWQDLSWRDSGWRDSNWQDSDLQESGYWKID
jgi:hypothetical protein